MPLKIIITNIIIEGKLDNKKTKKKDKTKIMVFSYLLIKNPTIITGNNNENKLNKIL